MWVVGVLFVCVFACFKFSRVQEIVKFISL